jgi:hypothetical protein
MDIPQFVYPLMNIEIVSSLGILQIKLVGIFVHKSLHGPLPSFLLELKGMW